MCEGLQVEYRAGASAFTPAEFVSLAQRVWPRDYDVRLVTSGVRWAPGHVG
jgi:hypothetical protein